MASGRNTDGHVVDVDQWTRSLAEILEDVPQHMCSPGHPGRISRIPENLRQVDAKAYEPYFLSFGPYHHGKTTVQRMEKRKRVVLKCFLLQNPELTLKGYLKEIKSLEQAARSFYSDVNMDSDKFMQMLLLDSFYIVMMFCGMAKCHERKIGTSTETGISVENENKFGRVNQIIEGMSSEDDNQNTQNIASYDETVSAANKTDQPRWFWPLFAHDLFLLENQLPFFVLQKVHDLTYGDSATPLILTIKNAFRELLWDYTKIDPDTVISPTQEIHHLLHLCHFFFRPILQPDVTSSQLSETNQTFRLGSAVQLYEAGVSFEAQYASTQYSLLDISFGSSGKMVIPCLHVDSNTDSILRNLIALEQMKYPSLGLNVSAYAVMLLHLVTTPEDVRLLRSKGIIQHHLASDKEMMYLVNRLSVGLAFDYAEDMYSLKPVFRELKVFTENRVPGWQAWLKHRYFYNPWTAISLFAASLLLLLTIVQTFYAVYSYYHPF